MKNFKIEVFTGEFQKQVVDLVLTIQQEFNTPVTLAEQIDLHDVSGFYQRGVGNFWVALLNGKVVGTIAVMDIGNQQVALRKMFVEQSLRGKGFGIGQALLEEVFSYCAKLGLKEIYLGTTAFFLAAHRFYEKNGFREIAIDQLPESFSPMPCDTKFYFLKVFDFHL